MMGGEWKEVKIGDVIETQKGFAFKSEWYSKKGRAIIKVKDFTTDSIDTSNLTFIPEELTQEFLKYELKTNDIVIQTVGSWPSNPSSVVGKVIRIPESASGALLNQNAVIVKPQHSINNTLLYYYLKSNMFKNYVLQTAQGSANQASITIKAITNFKIFLPPFTEQKAIAHILGTLGEKIELNRQMDETLDAMAQTLFQNWIIRGQITYGQ